MGNPRREGGREQRQVDVQGWWMCLGSLWPSELTNDSLGFPSALSASFPSLRLCVQHRARSQVRMEVF